MGNIFLVRHGKTDMNKRYALLGKTEDPLNSEGIKEAEKLSEWFEKKKIRFSSVYSSPRQRAVKTAGIIAPYCEVTVDEILSEMDYGPYEGIDLRDPPEEIKYFFSDFVNNPAPDGMEPLSEVVARAGKFIESLKNVNGDVLVVTHAITIKGILEYIKPDPSGSYWKQYIGNCAAYRIKNENGSFSEPEEVYPGA